MKKILFILTIVAITLFSCGKNKTYLIRFKVTCYPSGFTLSYNGPDNKNISKIVDAASYTASDDYFSGTSININAQAQNNNAEITIKLFQDDVLVGETHLEGDLVAANLFYTIP